MEENDYIYKPLEDARNDIERPKKEDMLYRLLLRHSSNKNILHLSDIIQIWNEEYGELITKQQLTTAGKDLKTENRPNGFVATKKGYRIDSSYDSIMSCLRENGNTVIGHLLTYDSNINRSMKIHGYNAVPEDIKETIERIKEIARNL